MLCWDYSINQSENWDEYRRRYAKSLASSFRFVFISRFVGQNWNKKVSPGVRLAFCLVRSRGSSYVTMTHNVEVTLITHFIPSLFLFLSSLIPVLETTAPIIPALDFLAKHLTIQSIEPWAHSCHPWSFSAFILWPQLRPCPVPSFLVESSSLRLFQVWQLDLLWMLLHLPLHLRRRTKCCKNSSHPGPSYKKSQIFYKLRSGTKYERF